MGRKKKPTELKALQGTNRKDRGSSFKSNSGSLGAMSEPPGHLNDVAQSIWFEYMDKLKPLGVIGETDLELFASFCCEAATYREAVETLEKDGSYVKEKYSDGTVKAIRRHPAITVRNNAFKNMKAIGSEFGLSPHSKQAIIPETGPEDALDLHLRNRPGNRAI